MEKLVRPNDLPNPWELTEEWLERLEVEESLKRHYFHLSEAERLMLEGVRRTFWHYHGKKFLQEGKTLEALVGRMVKDIDRSWLRSTKGRAVDFKKALKVLETYARYHEWASEFRKIPWDGLVLLDLILPYWVRGKYPDKSYGPGFLRVQITVYSPELGHLGEVEWGSGVVELTELNFTERWGRDEDIDPFERLGSLGCLRTFTVCLSDSSKDDDRGLLDIIVWSLNRVLRKSDDPEVDPFFSKEQEALAYLSYGSPSARIQVRKPRAYQIQAILDRVALFHFSSRFPEGEWQLQFDVADDLTSIKAASVLKKHSPFGCFYTNRKYPLNPPREDYIA